MVFYCAFGEEELFCYLAVGHALGYQGRYFTFPYGEVIRSEES